MLGRFVRAREMRHAQRDNNRITRPFEWGTSFVAAGANGGDPRRIFLEHTARVMARSEEFYALPKITDYQLEGDQLTWTSAVETPAAENNVARARLFPAKSRKKDRARRAIVVVPQWNAQPDSHVEACRIFKHLGITALRLTLPYHEQRRPPELERADYLVSSNVGRTIQSMRQAALDARAAARWLRECERYERIGILGTSVGSCVAFLAFAHDEGIGVGVFNHVSGYFADVVWRGISTRHVRAGFADRVTLDELREYWMPISPLPFIQRLLAMKPRPMRLIATRYDLTFPPDLSRKAIAEVKRLGLPVDVVWLPCGHYSLADMPWKAIDAWKIATFFRKHL